ncbi:MAG: PAS domain S-box protein, partial [Myxococcales bacterium]|nr:PAS domain S-box protein [Myxococcales bacterium]
MPDETAPDPASELDALRRRVEALERQLADARRSQSLIDALPHGVQECDREGTIVYCNQAFARQRGRAPAALLGRKIWEVAPEPAGATSEQLRAGASSPTPTTNLASADGERVTLQVEWDYARADDGRVLGYRSTYTDITEQIASERALRESQRWFRLLSENITSAFWIVALTPVPRLIYRNNAFTMLLGRPLSTLERDHADADAGAHPDDAQDLFSTQRWLLRGESRVVEFRNRSFGGEYRWFQMRAFPVKDERGEITHAVGLTDDITERKRTELALARALESLERRVAERTEELRAEVAEHRQTAEALHQLETHYTALFNAGIVGVFTAGPDGTIREANDAFLALVGRDRAALADGLPWRALIAPERYTASDERATQIRLGGAFGTFETTVVRPDGARAEVLVASTVVSRERGLCLVIDRTEARRAERALAESERNYRRFFEFGLIAMAEVDARGRWQQVNDSLCELLGCPRDRLIGRPWYERVHPEDRVRCRGLLPTRDDGGIGRCSVRFTRSDGERHTEIAAQTTGARVYVAIKDVTAHKRAEEFLRAEEARTRQLLDSVPIGIAVVQSARFSYANPALCELLQRSREEVLGGFPGDLVVHDEQEQVRARYSTLRSGEEPPPSEFTIIRPDGARLPVFIVTRRLDVFGDDTHLSVVYDVSERRRFEQGLRRSEERLRRITDAVPGAVVKAVFRSDGLPQVEFISRGVTALVGVTPEQVLSDPFAIWSRVHPEDLEAQFASIRRATRTRTSIAERFRVVVDGGAIRWVQVRFGPSPSADEPDVWYGIAEDITDRRALEVRVNRGERMEAIGRLAGGVAHDFNNILSTILGYAKLLELDLPADGEPARNLAEIIACSRRAAALTNQLLIFARKQVTSPQLVELNAAVAELARMYERLLDADIELVTRLCDASTTVRVDPSQLAQVLMNLIVNARDAMAARGGRLEITTARRRIGGADAERRLGTLAPGEYVELRVSDTGCGFDEATRERIFEPFFTTKRGGGTGLGLS